MLKRPILLAAAVTVAGLAAFGTVAAQQPSGGYAPPRGGAQPKGGTQPATSVVRPYGDWTPTAQPGGVRPAGGGTLPPPAAGAKATNANYPPPGGTQPNRPRLHPPGVAGAEIKPAGGFDVPAPSMEMPGLPANPIAPEPPAGALPPPSISLDPADNKFPPAPPVGTPPVGTPPETTPTVSAPPVATPPAGEITPPQALPSTPVTPHAIPEPKPLPAPPVGLVPPQPTAPGAVAPPAINGGLMPSKASHSVTVEAVCPESVIFNTEYRYEIVVRNESNVAVQGVRVEDVVPASARYVGSDPPGELNGDKLVWALGAMESKAEKRIAVRVRPTEEGELQCRATVSFTSVVDAKTKVTRPRLAVSATCAESCRAGEDAVFQIKVTNSGTGPAQNMVLRADMSDGLIFTPSPRLGPKLETTLDNLPAGATKTLTLPLNASKSGAQACQFTVSASGCESVTTKASLNVVEPKLEVAQSGPAKCLVRAEPTYEITLSNPGTASTDGITVSAVLPDGFDFVQASDGGSFSTNYRSVSWKLTGLAPSGTKTVALKLRAAAAGDVVLRTVAVTAPEQGVQQAGAGAKPTGRVLEAKTDTAIKSEGVAAVRFEVKDLVDPIEVGKDAVYEIRVMNQGTGACTNVQLLAALSEGTTFSGATGPTNVKAQGQTLVFEPIQTLAVKGEPVVYTVRVRGNVAGDQRFRVQLTCDQFRTPVVKEESSTFYKQ